MRHVVVFSLLFLLSSLCAVKGQIAAVELVCDPAGGLHLEGSADWMPALFDSAWKYSAATAVAHKSNGEPDASGATERTFTIVNPSGGTIHGTATFSSQAFSAPKPAVATDRQVVCRYVLTADQNMTCNALMVAFDLPVNATGAAWKTDTAAGEFPAHGDTPQLFNGLTKQLTVAVAGGLTIEFPEATRVLIQDNRRWGPGFSLRLGPQPISLVAGQSVTIAFTLRGAAGLDVVYDRPVTITAGSEWIPLTHELDVEPGSALDWSTMHLNDAPAGKYGRVLAQDGQFVFADNAQKNQRFYGVNLCFSAQYVDHKLADQLADRLRRAGYNSVRIHHYEGGLTDGKPGFEWSAERLDQFDYLVAALISRGMYLTTDLYVSRPVAGVKNPKIMIPVDEAAFQDWRTFTTKFLTHVNPYTKRSYAAEPALGWLVMINEGNFGNYWNDLRILPAWTSAWAAWCTAQKLPATPLPDDFHRADVASFLAATERASFRRMAAVVREELHCQALLSNTNGWTNLVTDHAPRADYDFIDDHFYVDHPEFIEKDWQLPSRCDNRNPLRTGQPGGSGNAFVRQWGKPFTISEFNYSSPGRYRGVGGMLTGALGALQDWSALWRFAYAHNREAVASPQAMNYFDIASDPLNSAAERAAILLYLRGDLAPASTRLGVVLPVIPVAGSTPVPSLAPPWTWAAWQAQVGIGAPTKATAQLAYLADTAVVKAAIGTTPTGLRIDAARGSFTVDTPRLAGGFAERGGAIVAGPHLRVAALDQAASVTIAALDDKPLQTSERLLLTHLTDVQNSNARYAERTRKTLLSWGTLPHLAAAGTATISFATSRTLEVWSLTMSGKRVARIPAKMTAGRLEFTVAINGQQAHLYYELTASPGR